MLTKLANVHHLYFFELFVNIFYICFCMNFQIFLIISLFIRYSLKSYAFSCCCCFVHAGKKEEKEKEMEKRKKTREKEE